MYKYYIQQILNYLYLRFVSQGPGEGRGDAVAPSKSPELLGVKTIHFTQLHRNMDPLCLLPRSGKGVLAGPDGTLQTLKIQILPSVEYGAAEEYT